MDMFAPYCPTCRQRTLLGPRRIVSAELQEHGAFRVLLRCFCDTVVRHDNPVPITRMTVVDDPAPRVA